MFEGREESGVYLGVKDQIDLLLIYLRFYYTRNESQVLEESVQLMVQGLLGVGN